MKKTYSTPVAKALKVNTESYLANVSPTPEDVADKGLQHIYEEVEQFGRHEWAPFE